MGRISGGSTAGGRMFGWAQTHRLPPTPNSSPVVDLSLKYHCNLKCKWATDIPSCTQSKKSLENYFKEHGGFNIVREEYTDKYTECPLYERRDDAIR